MGLRYHRFADAFPKITGTDRDVLVASIGEHGIKEKIVMLTDEVPEGEVLDGRNRYECGVAAGVFPEDVDWRTDPNFVDFRDIEPDMDPYDWVILKNRDRRHMTEGQRAIAAHKLEGFRHGGVRKVQPGEQDANWHLDTEDADSVDPALAELAVKMRDRKTVAEELHVSPRSVARAAKVTESGAPELVEAVEQGTMAVSAAAEIATLPKDQQIEIIKSADPAAISVVVKEIRDKRTAEKKAKRAEKEQQLGRKRLAIGDRKASVLYVDIDWRFLTRSDNGLDRSADNHYPTSKLIDIMKRPVSDMAAEDAVIFFWATVPMLIEAICVLDAYGFVLINRDPETGFLLPDKSACQYVSHLAWIKTTTGDTPANGTGYWFRNGHEVLLVARRGNVIAPAMGTQPNSVLWSPRGVHSAKPEDVLELIERWYPTVPKLELHRRGKPRPGWWAWGNEVEPDPENGVTVDENGFADASHLPLLTSHSMAPVEAPDGSEAEPTGGASSGPRNEPAKAAAGPDSGAAASTSTAAPSAMVPGRISGDHELEQRFRAIGKELPKKKAERIEVYQDAMRAYDSAMRFATADGARLAGERMGAVLFKANKDRLFGLESSQSTKDIRRATAAPLGEIPIWGQNGCFIFKGRQVEAIVECAWPTLNLFATSFEPFLSETGFRAVQSDINGLGMSVARYVEAVVAQLLAEPGGALVTPQTIYRIGRVGPVPVPKGDAQ